MKNIASRADVVWKMRQSTREANLISKNFPESAFCGLYHCYATAFADHFPKDEIKNLLSYSLHYECGCPSSMYPFRPYLEARPVHTF